MPVWVQDVAIALFVTVMQVQGTVRRVDADPGSVLRPLDSPAYLGFWLIVLSGSVLVWRRRRPTAVFAVAALASAAYYTLDYPDGPGWLALFVATYTLTAYGDGRRSLVLAAVGTTALSGCWLVASADTEPRAALGWVFFRIGATVMSAALGESVRSRRAVAAEALTLLAAVELASEEHARARVDAERVRIAREVHDTVAHAIAIINVQAGVTGHVLDKRPEQARTALRTIEVTSSQALSEMRAVLGVLRGADGEPDPVPDVPALEALAARARDAGLEVHLAVGPQDASAPAVVRSAAYRILQESLTNVIHHVGPTRVDVVFDYGAEALDLTIQNAAGVGGGPPVRTGTTRRGHGIRGMHERCRLLGGDLRASALPDGGFEVRAHLPLMPTEPRPA